MDEQFKKIEKLLEQHRYDEAGFEFSHLLSKREDEREEALMTYLGVIAAYFDALAVARAEYRDALAVSIGLLKDAARLEREMKDDIDLARVGHEINHIRGNLSS